MYKNIETIDFIEVEQATNPEQWLEIRRSGIGGSDAGTIMGGNPYSTKLSVYMAKKGFDSFTGNVNTEWGHILEDPIRQKTAEELGVKIETVPGTLRSKEYPFMLANLDGLMDAGEGIEVNGQWISGIGGHEIKTSAKGDGFGESEIPDSYYWQVQHYMAVTGLKWFVLTAFILSKKTAKHYVVLRHDLHVEELIQAEKDFWENYVSVDVPPEPEGGEREETCLKSCNIGGEFELDEGLLDFLDELENVKQEIKALKDRESWLKNTVMLAMVQKSNGNEAKAKGVVGNYKITFNLVNRSTIDKDALRHDGLLEKYSKQTSSREMRVSRS